MKKFSLAFYCFFFTVLTYGQGGHLPPVTYSSGANVCDPSDWKLIFFDDFNGTALDNTKWKTFNAWASMPYGDNDDWSEGRSETPYRTIIKDANVVVSGGTCKLLLNHEPASWHCSTCSMTTVNTNYTTGQIRTYYNYPNGSYSPPGTSFRAGKFEARIKMPTFNKAHGTFWLWHGSSINEIDIAEAYGDPYFPYIVVPGNNRHCDYSLHAWPPPVGTPNPYGMNHVEVMNRYPHQTWWDYVCGTYFKQEQWNTYTCEWDTAVIRTYLNGALLNTEWKYYQTHSYSLWYTPFVTYHYMVGSNCNPSPGSWNVMQGFPYNNNSLSNLNFTLGIDDDVYSGGTYSIGQMEIDYVKIWQKHPELDGFSDICDGAKAVVNGPPIICSTATYTAIPPSSGGIWFISTNLNTVSSSSSSITVQKNGLPPFSGCVSYYPMDPSCPNPSSIFLANAYMDVGNPLYSTAICVGTASPSSHTMHFNLHVDPSYVGSVSPLSSYYSATTFEWNIDYGPSYSLHHHVFGQFVSTPDIAYTAYTAVPIKWQVIITNACGSVTKTGYTTYAMVPGMATAMVPPSDTDSTRYFYAEITDSVGYINAVLNQVAQTFVDDTTDTVAIGSMINRIAAEELGPYIIFDSIDTIQNKPRPLSIGQNANVITDTKIYPNPTNNILNIALGGKYMDGVSISIEVHDIVGILRKKQNFKYSFGTSITVDISDLPDAIYMIDINQNKIFEHLKILKTSK